MVCAIEQYEHCCSIIIIIALQFNTAQWQCFLTHVVVILRPNKTTIAEKYIICSQIQVGLLYRAELVA